jgi:4-diphosphocytidyl-2-C-methyl-D-erythritol kinase
LAAELGSDVPFFLYGGAAVCSGRGEKVERLCGMPQHHMVIVKPPGDLNTADVYRAYDTLDVSARQRPCNSLPSFARLGRRGVFATGRCMYNGLQPAAAAISPWVERLKVAFDKLGFVAHQLSGSGSAYFGVCRHAQHARRLATILRTQQLGLVYTTRSCA